MKNIYLINVKKFTNFSKIDILTTFQINVAAYLRYLQTKFLKV